MEEERFVKVYCKSKVTCKWPISKNGIITPEGCPVVPDGGVTREDSLSSLPPNSVVEILKARSAEEAASIHRLSHQLI